LDKSESNGSEIQNLNPTDSDFSWLRHIATADIISVSMAIFQTNMDWSVAPLIHLVNRRQRFPGNNRHRYLTGWMPFLSPNQKHWKKLWSVSNAGF